MNILEATAREIYRVARLMPHYEALGLAGSPALLLMRSAIEQGFLALGSGDADAIIRAHADLIEFKE